MNFYEISYFYDFSMLGGAGNPPGGSGDTRDRFYIDKKKVFFNFLNFLLIFISILLINVPWMA